MPEITIVYHARKSMDERGISDEEVNDCVLHPQQIELQANGRSLHKSRVTLAGKPYVLLVAVEPAADEIVVVTVIRTSKIRKYWRS